MNRLRSYFDSLSSNMTSGSYNRSASFVTPGIKAGASTKICIAFRDTPEYLNLAIDEQQCTFKVQPEPDAPDLTINIGKSVSEFRETGLQENDIEIEGLTNRKSTNSKILNCIDAAYYFLNGTARTLNGIQSL
jgi:hypothetical protein